MKTRFTLVRMASVVLLAWTVAGGSVNTGSGTAIEIGVTGRANANASIASSGSIRGCCVGGPHERRRHGRLRGDEPRRRARLRSACARESSAWRCQRLRRATAADRAELSRVHQSCNRGAVDSEVCIRDSSRIRTL